MAHDLNYDIKGKSVKDFLELSSEDLQKMNYSSLKKVGARLVSLSNHRIARLEKQNVDARDISKWAPQNKFSVKGLNITQLQAQIRNMKNFLNVKTTNIGAFKKHKEQVKDFSGFENEDDREAFYKAYSDYEKSNKGFFKEFKYEIKESITTEIKKGTNKIDKLNVLGKVVNLTKNKYINTPSDEEDKIDVISSFKMR